jgi:hypothetical protein
MMDINKRGFIIFFIFYTIFVYLLVFNIEGEVINYFDVSKTSWCLCGIKKSMKSQGGYSRINNARVGIIKNNSTLYCGYSLYMMDKGYTHRREYSNNVNINMLNIDNVVKFYKMSPEEISQYFGSYSIFLEEVNKVDIRNLVLSLNQNKIGGV